jgi:transposase-like protein
MHLTSRDAWDTLAAFLRKGIERLVQQLLEEEANERLAEQRVAAAPSGGGAPAGCRSGHGRPRRLRTMAGDLRVRRPRLRGFSSGFSSQVLPSFVQRYRQAGQLQMELYLAGLAAADFDRALAGLLGGPPHLSESATARVRRAWLREQQAWRCAPLGRLEPRYLWIDRLGMAGGPGLGARTPLLVAIASLTDGTSTVLAVEPSAETVSVLLRRLRERGLPAAQLVVGGGDLAPPRRVASSLTRAPR